MPASLKTFTKSKWLAFFAELTAKITHHNVYVVMEGCEIIKRILVSRVSVAAFLEEGGLLTHLVDTIAGDMLSHEGPDEGPPLAIADKLLFTQLETLSLFVDMMVALYADKDPYYSLLVLARAGVILGSLVNLLQRQHPRFFGILATMVQALLRLPLGREERELSMDAEETSAAFVCHVQQLQAVVAQHGALLQEAVDILRALTLTMDGAMRHCGRTLLNMAEYRLQRLQRHGNNSAGFKECLQGRNNFGLNRSEHVLADTTMENTLRSPDTTCFAVNDNKMSVSKTHESEETTFVADTEVCVSDEEYATCFDHLSRASSHNEFLGLMNHLWCLTVASGDELQRRFTSLEFDRVFKRFLQAMPTNHQDQVVFTSVLLWLSHMMSRYYLLADTRDSLLSITGASLIKIILQDLNARDVLSSSRREHSDFFTHASTSSVCPSSLSCVHNFSPEISSGERAHALVERPSTAFVVLSFLLIAERACGPQHMEQWIREAGLFAMIEVLIRGVEETKSAVIDMPTTVNGTLSDDVYLACAMRSARTENVTLAVLSCKLLSSVIWNHHTVLSKSLALETFGMLQTSIPVLLKIAIHNPTVTSVMENVPGSALHHLPSCQRSSRHTSLGECSLIALDACFWLVELTRLDAVCLKDIIQSLPALSRATRSSIHPPLRGSVYRCLMRFCGSPTELMIVHHEMPSLMGAAVRSVLEYTTTAPQWEAAAAAEWLAHVIQLVSTDATMEQSFNLTQTALPVKLLELVSSNGINYATAAMLFLLTSLFEQQKRLADSHHALSTNIVLPYGKRSLECWFQMIRVATQNNEKLAHVRQRPTSATTTTTTTTKDALSRFLSGIEGISVQFFFMGSLARGLIFLLTSHPEHRDVFLHDMIYGLLVSVFALPPPDAVFDMLSVRFGAKVTQHAALEKAYEDMVQWVLELCFLWFGTAVDNTQDLAPLPSVFYAHLCDIIKNENISQHVRANVCAFVSSIVAVPSVAFCNVLATFSGDLFAASLALHPVSSVTGMQCRLVALFLAANEKAREGAWLATRVAKLEEEVGALKENAGLVGAQAMESLTVSLSLVCSVLSFSDCPQLPRDLVQALCSSLRSLLGYEMTRRVAFQAAGAIVKSGEGRRCLLHEISTIGEPILRTCFGRILGITLDVSQPNEHMQLQKENNNAMKRTPLSEREASRAAVMTLGFDVCATACGKGGESFTRAMMKIRGVEHMTSLFLKYERRRVLIPMGLFRLAAAISFYSEAQLAIIRQGELMTIIVETAENVSCAGTLSLLTLRNLCFNPALKTQLCQDSRILLTLKAALMTQPASHSQVHDDSTSISKDNVKTGVFLKNEGDAKRVFGQKFTEQIVSRQSKKLDGVSPASGGSCEGAELLRRQELAVTAFWSLMYDSQRGKSYIRGLFNQAPAINMNKLMASFEEGCVCAPGFEKYSEKMTEAIGNIKLLVKGAI